MAAEPNAAPLPRVCIVGPLPPPSGGMANQCEQLARLLAADGIAVEVVRNNAPYRPAWIGSLPVLRAGFRLVPYLRRLWTAAGRADVMHVLANSGWAWHLFAAPAVWVGRVRRTPVIINYRGGNADTFFSAAPGIVQRTLRMASLRVTPSGYLLRVFKKHALDACVVPNIIDLSRFSACTPRDFKDAPHLIVTRNLEDIYDIPTALKAFAMIRIRFPRARLTVAGSGPARPQLLALAHELKVDAAVDFCGRIDNAKIPALYSSADCMLNPTTVDNMPISILEAFASGVPVISTNAGGIPDIATDGVSARLVPIGDANALAASAIEVLESHMACAHMVAAGRQEAECYSWTKVGPQWHSIYQDLMRRKTRT